MPNIDYGSPVVSGNVEVTATVAETKRTVAFASEERANAAAGNTTLLTVPTGKTCRVLGMSLTGTGRNNSNELCRISLNGSIALQCNFGSNFASGSRSSNSNVISFEYANCPVITAGQTIVFYSTASNFSAGQVYYILEDV